MAYLLDTNVCIDLMRGRSQRLIHRIHQTDPADLAMSMITLAELMYGAVKSKRLSYHQELISGICAMVGVVPFDADAANQYGSIRCELESRGQQIGQFDLLIAAHALAIGFVLVTNNVREFARVSSLQIENWLVQR